MFCPTCGQPEQTPNGYCRSCGEFLADPKAMMPAFGGSTTRQNIKSINVLSLIAAIASLATAIWMYTTYNVSGALYTGAAMLLCNALWHISNIVVSRKLGKRLEDQGIPQKGDKSMPRPTVRPQLSEMNTNDLVPRSVVEDTTRHLDEKILR